MRKRLVIFGLLFFSLPALAMQVEFSPPNAYQGKCFLLQLISAEGIVKAEADFLNQKIDFFETGIDLKAIFGVPPEQPPGVYRLGLRLIGPSGAIEKKEIKIKVEPSRFASVRFKLKPAKKKLLVQDLIAKEWAEIEKVLLVEKAEQAWSGKFTLPVTGPASMTFGTLEYINGKRSGRHRGYDLAVPIGTPVKAAEAGRVVYAAKLKAFGGTLVIDHGQGIHSLYFHLSRFLKEPGQTAAKGEIVALSGNSGISSGPHLHWGLSVHNLRVDPLQWVKYAF
jgi:murein DD-endopeptidase MepM/ murein hydrolase activator NlpD